MIFVGAGAFLLFAMGDYNDAFLKNKILKLCFPLGMLLLIAATALRLDASAGISLLWCALAFAFLLLELYALFGVFSVSEAYAETESERSVCSRGVYALCRHPGVLFFAGLYACLCPGLNLPWQDAVLYTALDIALVAYEDFRTFPHILKGYEEYRKQTPFLIPNVKSFKNMLKK